MSETRRIADRYELLEQIDAGGMGDVYRAIDARSQTVQPHNFHGRSRKVRP